MKARPRSDEDFELSVLLKKAQAGDKIAYQEFLTLTSGLLADFAQGFFRRSGLGADPSWEDAVQETLVALHTKRHTYNASEPFFPWFYAIARYKLIDSLRTRGRHGTRVDMDLDLIADITPSETETMLARQDLTELLSGLPEKQRRSLQLVKIEGLSIAETSGQLGISQSDVKVSIHRAVKKLRELSQRNANGNG